MQAVSIVEITNDTEGNLLSWISEKFPSLATAIYEPSGTNKETIDDEIQKLAQLAWANLPESSIAREFIFFALRTNAKTIPHENRESAKAAFTAALSNCCYKEEQRTQVAPWVLSLLAHAQNLSTPIRKSLLAGFDQLALNRLESGVSLEEICLTLIQAIDLELSIKQSTPDFSLTLELIKRTVENPHPNALPLLASIAEVHLDESVRESAKATIYLIEHSTFKQWQDTTPDLVSNNEERVSSVLQAIDAKMPTKDFISLLFRKTKERCIGAEHEQLTRAVASLLDHCDFDIKLAASRILLQTEVENKISNHPNSLLERVILTLTTIAFSTSTPQSASEAASLLQTLTNASDEVKILVEKAQNAASLDFIQKQT